MRAHPAGKLGEGATAVSGAELCERLFQSTPPRGGATVAFRLQNNENNISIHAPREGGDPIIPAECDRSLIAPGNIAPISIHAPREGGD